MKRLFLVWAATLMLSLAIAAWAQTPPQGGGPGGAQGPGGAGGPPPRPDFARELGLSAEKAAQLESVLKAEREQMDRMRAENRSKLAAVLTPEQLARLEQMRPGPPRPPMQGGGAQGGGAPQGGGYGPGGAGKGGPGVGNVDCNRPRG